MTAGFNIIYTKQNFLYHKRMKKVYFYRICLFLTVTVLTYASFSQEALKSTEEEYYDFIGEKKLRPIINVRPHNDENNLNVLREALLTPGRISKKKKPPAEQNFLIRGRIIILAQSAPCGSRRNSPSRST